MPSIALDECLIWFAHCPKAGGTSIEALLVEKWGDRVGHLSWGWDIWWKNGGWREASPPNSPQHLIWSDAESMLPSRPDEVFALVREPAARMQSEHRYQRRHRRGTRVGRLLALLPFPVWLRVMLAVVRRNPYAFDNHLRPQSDFIPEQAAVFRLEDGLEDAISWLAAVTKRRDLTMPDHMLKSGESVPASPAVLARIGAAYRADYSRFGYRFPEIPDPKSDVLDKLAEFLAPLVVVLDRRGRL